jgi:hypothetical protein
MTEDHGVPGSTPGIPIFQSKMKNKKLENTLETAKIITRAAWFLPYITVRMTGAMIGEEIKGAYYRARKIPHTTFERDPFIHYIRLDK